MYACWYCDEYTFYQKGKVCSTCQVSLGLPFGWHQLCIDEILFPDEIVDYKGAASAKKEEREIIAKGVSPGKQWTFKITVPVA